MNLPYKLRYIAKYPFVHLPDDSKTLKEAADELEHLTEMVEQLIVGAVACVEVVVENERLFSENKLLNYKLEEEQKKTAENESLQRCLAYWQNLYSQQSKELYELEQKK